MSLSDICISHCHHQHVPPVSGRSKRPTNADAPHVLLQARVRPEVRIKARAAADGAGISIAAYLEALVDRDEVDPEGCPVWLPKKKNVDQRELPLKTA